MARYDHSGDFIQQLQTVPLKLHKCRLGTRALLTGVYIRGQLSPAVDNCLPLPAESVLWRVGVVDGNVRAVGVVDVGVDLRAVVGAHLLHDVAAASCPMAGQDVGAGPCT